MTTLTVPYADYDVAAVTALSGRLKDAVTALGEGNDSLRSHWKGLPAILKGDGIGAVSYYQSVDAPTKDIESLATQLQATADALATYAEQAATPVAKLKELAQEVATWSSSRPLDVIAAPGLPLQDLWAAQAGYAPGSVCLAESPWTAWNRRRTELQNQINHWAAVYDEAAKQCVSALRAVADPGLTSLWRSWGGSTPSRTAPNFSRGDNTWHDDRRFSSLAYGTHTRSADGSWSYEDKRAGREDGKGASDFFGYGVRGVNVSGEALLGWEGEASTSYGSPAGAHGDLAASARAGAYAEGTAGVNVKDGRLVAGASGEVGLSIEADASASVEYGLVGGAIAGSASVGANASGRANVSAGADGVKATVGASAFAGAEASADATVGVSGVKGTVGVTGYAGAGIKAEADVSFSADKVAVDVDLGVALGVGAGVKFSVDINPREVIEDIGDLFDFGWW